MLVGFIISGMASAIVGITGEGEDIQVGSQVFIISLVSYAAFSLNFFPLLPGKEGAKVVNPMPTGELQEEGSRWERSTCLSNEARP